MVLLIALIEILVLLAMLFTFEHTGATYSLIKRTMDWERKLRLILSINNKLHELDTSYTYQDITVERYEWHENVVAEICEELNVDYNKYKDKTIKELEKELVDEILYPEEIFDGD